MFLTFGNITFQGIKLPQNWDGNFETLYGQIPIIGRKPVVQQSGEKLDEYDISAFFHADFCNPRKEVNELQEMRKKGIVDYLVDGTGKNYGRFVITTLQENKITLLDNGYETAISVSIHLLEYNTNASILKQTGEALSSQNPVKADPLPAKTSFGLSINQDIMAGQRLSDKIQKSAISKPSDGMFSNISSMAENAKKKYKEASVKIDESKKIAYKAVNLKSSIIMVTSALEDVKAAAKSKNFNDLLTANDKLTYAQYYLNKSKSPLAAFIGSREGGR